MIFNDGATVGWTAMTEVLTISVVRLHAYKGMHGKILNLISTKYSISHPCLVIIYHDMMVWKL